LKWVRYLEVMGERGWRGCGYGVCLHRDYLVVVGSAGEQPYTALLNRADGRVVSEDVGLGEGSLYNCVSVGDRIYVAGSVMEVVGDSSGRYHVDRYTSIVFDGVSLYVGGIAYSYESSDGKRVWVIEKRDLSGETAYRRIVELSQFKDPFLFDMGVDPVTGNLWAIGGSKEYSLILVLDKNLDEIKQMAYPRGSKNYFGVAYGICFDGEGYAYVAGSNGLAKLSSRGELVAVNKRHGGFTKVACTGNYVYAFGDKRIEGYQRHVLVAFDRSLNSVKENVLSKKTRAQSYFTWGKPAFDGNTLYAAGWDEAHDMERIVVYAIQTASPNP